MSRKWQQFCFPAALAAGVVIGLLCHDVESGVIIGGLAGVALHMLAGHFCLPKEK